MLLNVAPWLVVINLFLGIVMSGESLHAQYRESLSPLSTLVPSASGFKNGFNKYSDAKEQLHEADKWLASDKVKHFGASFLLVVIGKIGTKEILKFDRAGSTTSAVGSALLVGFVKEVVDDLNPNNLFSLKDLVADLLGIGLALLVISFTSY